MAAMKFAKVVSSLPGTLEADTLYMVRVGAGFDLYMADNTGSTAHAINAAAPGTTDHGALSGLADDDHPQYHNDVRGDARYDALGSAAAAQAFAIQRANHTGTQTLSTISDAGTAASRNVPASGNAAAAEVVLGSDTRLLPQLSVSRTTAGSDGQTVFSISYLVGGSVFFLNGSLIEVSAITATDGTTATLASGEGVVSGQTELVAVSGPSGGASGWEVVEFTAEATKEFTTDLTAASKIEVQNLGIVSGSGADTGVYLQFFANGVWITAGYTNNISYASTLGPGGAFQISTEAGFRCGNQHTAGNPFTASYDMSATLISGRAELDTKNASATYIHHFWGKLTTAAHATKCRITTASGSVTGKFRLRVTG